MAVRDAGAGTGTVARAAGVQRRTAAGTGRYFESIDHPVRQSLRDQLSVHHGVSPGTQAGAALPCALLSATTAVGDGKEVHGRIRDVGHAAARHSAGRCRSASARGALGALPGEPVVMHRARATADEVESPRSLSVRTLENADIRAEVAPSLGGKFISLYSKRTS